MSERHLAPTPGFDPLAGRLVTMLADTRRRLHRDLEGLAPDELDRLPGWGPNSIGTLLYHIAAIELDWTFADLLGRSDGEFPDGTAEWFPVDVREDGGRLMPVVDPLERHMERLEWVRQHLLETIRAMSDDDLDRTYNEGDPDQEVGGAWILHHLMQHEAEHRGQIGEIKLALRASGDGKPL